MEKNKLIYDFIKQCNIYPMPKQLGGGWAFQSGGTISDGYKTKDLALKYAIKCYLKSIKELTKL